MRYPRQASPRFPTAIVMNNKTFQISYIRNFAKEIREGNAAIFAGAGLSSSCGLPLWKGLLDDFSSELGLESNLSLDPLTLAQFYENESGGRSSITQKIIHSFCKKVEPSECHKLLAKLPIKTYWTTNYDHLIEDSLEQVGKIVDVKRDQLSLSYTIPRRDAVVYKMHGDILSPHDVILTKNDYEDYNRSHELFISALRTDFLSKTFLFIGFGFADPNFFHIISKIKTVLGKRIRQHYYIIGRNSLPDNSDGTKALSREQVLKIEDLKRYGLYPIFVEDYQTLHLDLEEIRRWAVKKSIFISGSAATFAPIPQDEATEFLQKLAYQIAEEGNTIVTGFGLGVGPYIVNGALSHAYGSAGYSSEKYLIVRPFPQKCIHPNDDLKRTWKVHREELISQSGIAIYVFGNKLVDNEVVLANGMKEEFDLAFKAGLTPIPVSSTGAMAKEIWRIVSDNHKAYYSDINIYNEVKLLNDICFSKDNIRYIIGQVIRIIKMIQGEKVPPVVCSERGGAEG